MGDTIKRVALEANIPNETPDQRMIARLLNGNQYPHHRKMNRQILQLDDPIFSEPARTYSRGLVRQFPESKTSGSAGDETSTPTPDPGKAQSIEGSDK